MDLRRKKKWRPGGACGSHGKRRLLNHSKVHVDYMLANSGAISAGDPAEPLMKKEKKRETAKIKQQRKRGKSELIDRQRPAPPRPIFYTNTK